MVLWKNRESRFYRISLYRYLIFYGKDPIYCAANSSMPHLVLIAPGGLIFEETNHDGNDLRYTQTSMARPRH